MKRVILAMLLLISSVCTAQIPGDPLDRLEEFDGWALQVFRPQALKTLQGIRSLGPLVYEKSYKHELAHASSALERRELVFEGLIIHAVVETAGPHRVWVTTIAISSPAWALENGLAVGQNVAELCAFRCRRNLLRYGSVALTTV